MTDVMSKIHNSDGRFNHPCCNSIEGFVDTILEASELET